MKRIFLIGYMGVGKTTLGKELAAKIGFQFIDLDHYIQGRYQKTINEIFAELGESKFREIEHKLLKEVAEFEDAVVSTGGGTPCFYDNMDVMKQAGVTVYLKTDPEVLLKRLFAGKDKRPLIKDKSEDELLEFIIENVAKREPFYNQAQIVFETGGLVQRSDIAGHVDKLIEMLPK
ncbi:MAG: shikimate kinase [Bacteroidales bacterium 45-6]|nr:MAG: shikimate kinase [Bacteroidales bacterium 45-6]